MIWLLNISENHPVNRVAYNTVVKMFCVNYRSAACWEEA